MPVTNCPPPAIPFGARVSRCVHASSDETSLQFSNSMLRNFMNDFALHSLNPGAPRASFYTLS